MKTLNLPPWGLMWLLALAIFVGSKGVTYWQAHFNIPYHSKWRSFAYLFLWAGMDAYHFLDSKFKSTKPFLKMWIWAVTKLALGIYLFWFAAGQIPENSHLLRGWTGMIGLIFILHFGIFHLLALFWQQMGIDAKPLFGAPALSTSLKEFWGDRWNLGFRQLTHKYIFQPLRKRLDIKKAALAAFLVSGLLHDLVISVPAGDGYGLPTAYFVFQGLAVNLERSSVGKILSLGKGFPGWLYVFICTAGPAYFLFHPPFVKRVILPFMEVMGAL